MDRERFSAISHEGLEHWNPVAPEIFENWLEDLALTKDCKVLEVGCGQASLLLSVVERFGCQALGVDVASSSIEKAQSRARSRSLEDRLLFKCEAFDGNSVPDHAYDLSICIGSSHAISDYRGSLGLFARVLKAGGLLLIGEGYWQKEPPDEYLSFLGCPKSAYLSHAGNIALAKEHKFGVIAAHETSAKEWAQYEDTYANNVESFVAAHPNDPDSPAMAEKIRSWREAYLRWGKDTLGFGLYLLRLQDK